MNHVAARERFLVLYPEQDRVSDAQGCWKLSHAGAGRKSSDCDTRTVHRVHHADMVNGLDDQRDLAIRSPGGSVENALLSAWTTRRMVQGLRTSSFQTRSVFPDRRAIL